MAQGKKRHGHDCGGGAGPRLAPFLAGGPVLAERGRGAPGHGSNRLQMRLRRRGGNGLEHRGRRHRGRRKPPEVPQLQQGREFADHPLAPHGRLRASAAEEYAPAAATAGRQNARG
eukprot:869518-Pyramimonas_sp.AAC.1